MERWLSCILIPLLSLGMTLLCWRAAFRQGWSGVMPVLSRFVILISTSLLILLPIQFWTLIPGRLQPLACRIYSSGCYTLALVYSLFAFAVVVEVTKHTFGQSAQARRAFATVVTGGLYGLIVLIGYLYIGWRTAPDYRGLEQTLFLFTRIANLATILAVPVFFGVKRWRSITLDSPLAVILMAIGLYPLFDLVFSFAYQDKGGGALHVLPQTIGLIFWIVMYAALLRGPRLSSAASSQ